MNKSNQQPASTLKTAVSAEYSRENLSPEQLENLSDLQDALLAGDTNTNHDNSVLHQARRHWLWAMAACLALTLGWNTLMTQRPSELPHAIALEVAGNHLKLKPLDVETASIQRAQQFFTQLDFLPASSTLAQDRFSIASNTMLGGRYCSIQGITAAQLRFKATDLSSSTLYQVSYDQQHFGILPNADAGEEPLNITVKGLSVYLWIEKGLLMALVQQ